MFNEEKNEKLYEVSVDQFAETLGADIALLRTMCYGWTYSTPELIEALKTKIQASCSLIIDWTDSMCNYASGSESGESGIDI